MSRRSVRSIGSLLGLGTTLALVAGCPSSGPVHLTVALVLDHCPLVTSWRASPLQASAPDGVIDVEVTAHQLVVPDADFKPLEYMWSATMGTFAESANAATTYKCTKPGEHVLTASVVDSNGAKPCADQVSMTVTCK
jgi:hypothetical protein